MTVARDFRFGDKFNGVGTFYPSAYTLCKTSKFIGSGSAPGMFEFGVLEELFIFNGLASFHFNNGVCTVVSSGKDASGNTVFGWVARHAPVLCKQVAMLL